MKLPRLLILVGAFLMIMAENDTQVGENAQSIDATKDEQQDSESEQKDAGDGSVAGSGSSETHEQEGQARIAPGYFGVDLIKHLVKEHSNENVFICPVSLHGALTMALLGARSATRTAMERVLHFKELPDEAIRKSHSLLMHSLASEKDVIFKASSQVFIQDEFPILPKYQNELETAFGVAPSKVNFADSQEVLNSINGFISTATQGFLKDTLQQPLPSNTMIAFVSVAYFKGNWEHQFDKRHTSKQPFTKSDGSTIDVDMMRQAQHLGYSNSSTLNAQIVKVPYKGKQFAMILVVPSEGQTAEKLLSETSTRKLLREAKNTTQHLIRFFLPRFAVNAIYELKDTLEAAGIGPAFSGEADFSGISEQSKLKLSTVIHQARVEVDETGTEAAAATVAAMVPRRAGTTTVKADRPFLFMIAHEPTDIVLFLGIVADPTAGS